ncbi:MAG: glycosyltransferase family 4 protein [Lachnospiraceae bacterium]|nr:glycosyltransferase family 4 protein [Lachnospiraceae bacterium]
MKILWLIGKILPKIAESRGDSGVIGGGWTVKLADILSEDPDIDLTVVYPQSQSKEVQKGEAGKIRYFGFFEPAAPLLTYSEDIERDFRTIIKEVKPDLVHIWGTEYVHTLCMVKAFDDPDRLVISIQGLIYFWGKKYCDHLPKRVLKKRTFRDLIKKDSIYIQKQKFLKRGEFELEALKRSKHVIGRTDWDKSTALSINGKLNYHYCREIMREEFYEGEGWKVNDCEPHSVFISQGSYPVKGFHIALEILNKLKISFPDVKLYAAGKKLMAKSFKEKLKQDSYSAYIQELIGRYKLEDNISFLGNLDAQGMKRSYLKANVYLQSSIMENSPNSLGEAMLIGTPCVASDVGGTSSMVSDELSNELFSLDDTDKAVDKILKIFSDKDYSKKISILERSYSRKKYDIGIGVSEYKRVYTGMMEN